MNYNQYIHVLVTLSILIFIGSLTDKNIGDSPFMIFDTRASCGCTHIEYERKPILPDSTTSISITYNADDMGRFHKTVSVYGNMEDSPLIIKLKGNIE